MALSYIQPQPEVFKLCLAWLHRKLTLECWYFQQKAVKKSTICYRGLLLFLYINLTFWMEFWIQWWSMLRLFFYFILHVMWYKHLSLTDPTWFPCCCCLFIPSDAFSETQQPGGNLGRALTKLNPQLNKAAKRQAKYFFSVFLTFFCKTSSFSSRFSRPFLIFDISAPAWRGKSTNSSVWLKAPTEANARRQTGRNPPRGERGTSQGHLCSLSQRASCHF